MCTPKTTSYYDINDQGASMYYLILALLMVLATILYYRWFATRLRQNKLPPGPTPIPIIGNLHLLGKLPHRSLHKLSQKYGPIMSIRLGSIQSVVVSSPDAAKLFLGTHDVVFASRPKMLSTKHVAYDGKGMSFAEYGLHWKSVRKFCALELLSAAKINTFAGMRREEIGLTMEEIKKASMARKVVNLSEIVGELIEDMTCRMIFGKKNNEQFVFKGVVDEVMEAAGTFNLADYLPFLARFDLQGLTKRLKLLSKDLDEMLEILIDEHEKHSHTDESRNHDQMDFIDILLSIQHGSSNTHDVLSDTIDRTSMKAILLDMVAGTIDTSKSSIEWVLSALMRYPRVMKELQKELKAVVGDKQVVKEIDLANMTYLHMVVKETFRLYPSSSLLFPHESTENIVINGYNIPKNTRVLVNYWAFGRDPKVWSHNWEEFLPERFLNREIDYRGPDCQLIGFGMGRRGCPGMNLGLLFTNLVVSNIVHSFDWELPNGMSPSDLEMNEKFGITTPRDKPLLAIPTYRI